MLSPELLKKIEHIFIKSRYLANDVFAGEYETAFRGRGMEFEEVREYLPGDDYRLIDWNVSARMDRPFVKIFREEREQTVVFLVDLSASENFGSVKRLKRDVVAEITAILSFAAVKSNDKVGLLIFSDRIEKYIPPKKGRGHVWHVISEILSHRALGVKSDLPLALGYLSRVLHRRAVCFVISDFLFEGGETPLKVAALKHDVIALMVNDPMEFASREGGLMVFRDLETGEARLVDFGSAVVKRRFEEERRKGMEELEKKSRSGGIDFLTLRSDEDYVKPLLRLFREREKRS